MKINPNDLERLQDNVDIGILSADEANVEKVRMQRVFLVTKPVPATVRRALNAAVKRGELKHIKKTSNKPEAYYHPAFEYLVPGERNRHSEMVENAIKNVCV